MIRKITGFRVDSTKVPADIDDRIGGMAARAEGIPVVQLRDFRITGKSIDARRGVPVLLYNLELDVDEQDSPAEFHLPLRLDLPERTALLHPVVVGTGPAGIFAALALALAGAKPLILDRGRRVEERYADYRRFLESRELDESSNLLLGEGGAGTFSDGKLYTGTRDIRAAFVLDTLARAGAPPEIRYLKRPHIGSDKLRAVAANLRKRIIGLGGEFRFGTEVTGLLLKNGRCIGVETAAGDRIEAPAVIVAPGLGGRELVQRMARQGAGALLKPFQIGCRIEHPQSFIDRAMYHLDSRPAALGAAEYHLVSRPGNGVPGVSSFCMCPGGEILNATAWRGHSVSNGMSDYARNGEFANGCLIATLPAEKFGSSAEAYEFLAGFERRIFESGGGDYAFPAQDAAAFLSGRNGLSLARTGCATGIVPGRLDRLIPPELATALRAALRHFDRGNPGFIRYGKFVGLETCVSSPLRFHREPDSLMSNLSGLYPCGEGVGCAGGIMSAAVDGLKVAEALLRQET